MWQVVHNPNITSIRHFAGFSVALGVNKSLCDPDISSLENIELRTFRVAKISLGEIFVITIRSLATFYYENCTRKIQKSKNTVSRDPNDNKYASHGFSRGPSIRRLG